MTKRNGIEMNLPIVDDLFRTQEERDNGAREYVKAIPLEKIRDFLFSSGIQGFTKQEFLRP